LQTIVSRSIDPSLPAVVSCTELHTDGIRNAVPTNVVIKGDTRSYSSDVQHLIERRMREICDGIARSHGGQCEVEYTHEFAPTVNSAECVPFAVTAAANVVGASMVDGNAKPVMTSEDFGAFLNVRPGAFVLLGNGTDAARGGTPLHNSAYDFNDDLLAIGANYFAEISRMRLPE
jgi:metal-dependent amidase/aminoacylase/carboxypeptidase family protein